MVRTNAITPDAVSIPRLWLFFRRRQANHMIQIRFAHGALHVATERANLQKAQTADAVVVTACHGAQSAFGPRLAADDAVILA